MNRRKILGVIGLAGSTLTLGCFRVAQDSEPNDTERDENSPQNNEESEDDESLLGNGKGGSEPHREPHNETTPGNTTEANNETRNETNTSETNDRQKRPTDDQLTPDKSKYNGSTTSQRRETESLPADSVSVTSNTKKKGHTYVTSGTVTNEIDETIDFVDIEVMWLDANGTTIGTSVATVRDIPPGESKEYRTSVSIVDLKGEPDTIDGTAYPQQYVN